MEEKQIFFTSKNITFLGVLTALIIVLQVLGSNIVVFGTVRLSFVLVPIVLGAIEAEFFSALCSDLLR